MKRALAVLLLAILAFLVFVWVGGGSSEGVTGLGRIRDAASAADSAGAGAGVGEQGAISMVELERERQEITPAAPGAPGAGADEANASLPDQGSLSFRAAIEPDLENLTLEELRRWKSEVDEIYEELSVEAVQSAMDQGRYEVVVATAENPIVRHSPKPDELIFFVSPGMSGETRRVELLPHEHPTLVEYLGYYNNVLGEERRRERNLARHPDQVDSEGRWLER